MSSVNLRNQNGGLISYVKSPSHLCATNLASDYFGKALVNDYGLSRITIAFFRASLSAVILFAVLAFRQPRSLRIGWRDVPFFLAFGLCGIAAFFIVYITAIDLAGMSVAAVLLYTTPAWVAVISAIFLSEPLTKRKTLAVVLAMIGCALMARVYDLHELQLNWLGILAGLGAGLCYALYRVMNYSRHKRRGISRTNKPHAESREECTRPDSTPGCVTCP